MEHALFIGLLIVSIIAVNVLVWLLIRKREAEPIDPRIKEILKLIRNYERNKGALLEIHEVNPDDVFLRKRGGL
jgi:hypothetical protein